MGAYPRARRPRRRSDEVEPRYARRGPYPWALARGFALSEVGEERREAFLADEKDAHRHGRKTGLTLWAVERTDAPGEVIGQSGFALVDGKGPDIEIAYHYARRAWGQGFATEAVVGCLERGFGPLRLERVIAICYPENTASWRVMEKAGMRSDGQGEYYGVHMKRYVADRATWRRPDGRGSS